MTALHRLSLSLDRFVSMVGKIAAWLAVPMMLVILFDVITRRYFTLGSTKLQELEWHIHGLLFLLAFGFAYMRNAHVRIELLRDGFSIKTRAWVEMAGILLLLLPYCVLMIYFGYGFAERSFLQNEVSSALTGLSHRWIIKAAVPVGFIIVFLAGLSVFLRCIVTVFGPDHLKLEAGEYLAAGADELDDEGHSTNRPVID